MTNSQKTFYFVFKSVIINRYCGFTKKHDERKVI